ncbi:MAG TPA: CoA pyrophosphatase [Sphingomicrobium sp.]|nr:CoA pyrophosphatase [Sphingomicrobium sp.]
MTLVDRLRAALAAPPSEAMIAGDLPEARALATIPAAVLIALTEREEPGVILTVRTKTLRTHAGQIAFPGGRIDPGEDGFSAALREAQEELDLDPSAVTIAGSLDEYRTVTGYVVTPVVGVVDPDLRLTPHDHEVADWFEAPLVHLLDPSNHRLETAVFAGRQRRYWQIEWNERRIWGASAAMLVNLSRRLRWAR